MGKSAEISVPKWDDIEPYVAPDGQICIYPLYAAKARGGVIDEAFNKEAPPQRRQIEIDDTFAPDAADLPVQARVMFDYSALKIKNHIIEPLNEFDRNVMDAIATLYRGPGQWISYEDIYRVIIGKKKTYFIEAGQVDMVRDSIKKFLCCSVEIKIIDYAEDSSIRDPLEKNGVRELFKERSLLPCDIMEEIIDGKGVIQGIYLRETPPLIEYVNEFEQASLFPVLIVDTPLVKTRKTIMLQSHVLRDIDKMYRDRAARIENGNLIKLDEIYALMEDKIINEKARTRKKVTDLLAYWKETRYIEGYNEVKSRQKQKIEGYTVLLCQDNRIYNLPKRKFLRQAGNKKAQLRLPH